MDNGRPTTGYRYLLKLNCFVSYCNLSTISAPRRVPSARPPTGHHYRNIGTGLRAVSEVSSSVSHQRLGTSIGYAGSVRRAHLLLLFKRFK